MKYEDLYLKFKELYLANIPYKDILTKLNITSYRYEVFLKQFRTDGLLDKKSNYTYLKNKALELRKQQGLSLSQISLLINSNNRTLGTWLKNIKSDIAVKCSLCSKEHYCEYGSGEFCSETCARTKSSLLANREAYWGKHPNKILNKNCFICNKEFKPKSNKQKCCSRLCGSKIRKEVSQETKDKLSRLIKERIKNRLHKGWSSRTKLKPSFPEKWFINYLNNNSITNYTRELKVGQYFIDFAFEDKKIAVEIDRKQHEEEDRKARDQRKDLFLSQEGWKIFRIKWEKPKTSGYNNMVNQCNLILESIKDVI